MPVVYIGVGSNINPEKNIIKAAKLLEMSADIIAVSTHYQTPPLNRRDQNDFTNAVWKIYTNLDSDELKAQLKDIEFRLGRKKTADKYAAREIDLDILLFDKTLTDSDIIQRDFIYVPLLELEPDIVLPGYKKALKDIVDPHCRYDEAAINGYMKKEYPNGPEKN